jgi:hypothetical protein
MTYSVKDVMKRYGVSERIVLLWIKTGDLKAYSVGMRTGGKNHWRVNQDSLDAFELLRSSPATVTQEPRRKKRAALAFYK